jgi:putative aldouronate transport system permease protein
VASQVSYIQKLAETSGEGGKIQFGITPMSIQLAAMIISVAPVMVVYPFFQKYFVRGVMIGAIKG